MSKRAVMLMWCIAAALIAYVALDFYSGRNVPLYKKFEIQWKADVHLLETSGKLPKAWSEVGEIKVTGGTPDTRTWLQRIKVPIEARKGGSVKLEILVIAWEENRKIGVTVQYNLSDRKTGEWIKEVGRTFIVKDGNQPVSSFTDFLKEVTL